MATNTSGIFTLGDVGVRQSTQSWETASDVWVAADKIAVIENKCGYLTGGMFPDGPLDGWGASSSSRVNRIDYSNDTTSPVVRGFMAKLRGKHASVASVDYGYSAGGRGNPYDQSQGKQSSVERMDFANDTSTGVERGPLAAVRYDFQAVGNNNFGYWVAGRSPDASNIFRTDYANDTAAAVERLNLSRQMGKQAGATGTPNYGYIAGGGDYPTTSTTFVDRIDYASDTTTAVAKGNITANKIRSGATGNAYYGYVGGGETQHPGGSDLSTIDRIDYSSDTTTATPKGPLSAARKYVAATGDRGFGYWGGGGGSSEISLVDRLDYANDTATAVARQPLYIKYTNMGGMSASQNALPLREHLLESTVPVGTNFGYTFGGYNGSYISAIQRIDYSNDTATASQTSSMPNSYQHMGTVGNTNYAWAQPGYGPAGSNLQRLDYANDSANTLPRATNPESNAGDSTGNQHYGYFSIKHPETSIYRIDYSNDNSATIFRAYRSVPSGIYSGGAASNSSYGYFAGGQQNGGTGSTTMDRIDYSNDTATAVAKGPLSANQSYGVAATGSAYFGYWAGGSGGTGPSPGARSTTDRLDYSSDTTACVAKGPLTSTKYHTGSTGSHSFGYWSGGQPGGGQTDVDRLDYSSDTTTMAPKGPLAIASYGHDAESSRANGLPTTSFGGAYYMEVTGQKPPEGTGTGYVGGGGAPAANSTVQRVDYANDTAIGLIRGYSVNTKKGRGSASSLSHGYWGGGFPAPATNIDRIDYSNDTATSVDRGPMTAVRGYYGGMANPDRAYWCGGSPAGITTVDRTDYANDTATAAPKGPLTSGRYGASSMGNPSFGYVAGGFPGRTTVDRLDYANDTATASEKGPLAKVTGYAAGVGNISYGYLVSGYRTPSPQPQCTIIERIDYANDTATPLYRGKIIKGRDGAAAAGNFNHGWFMAGQAPANSTLVDRFDYANDTASGSQRGPLPTGMQYCCGNSSGSVAQSPRLSAAFALGDNPKRPGGFGYWGGGQPYPGVTTVDRMNFANDTTLTVVKGPLTAAIANNAGTGNQNSGYMAGGHNSPGEVSTVDRIEYSTDLNVTVAKGPLTVTKAWGTMVGTNTYGYFGGGRSYPTPYYSRIERIDYSNDSPALSPKSMLTQARTAQACGNQSYGWFAGGDVYPSIYSIVDRLDYGNDTATAIVKGPLTLARYSQGACSNADYGYISGGTDASSRFSHVFRITFANDTATAASKGPLAQAGQEVMSTGNQSYGFASGRNQYPTQYSLIDRIDYSNDTAVAVHRGNLTRSTSGGAACSQEENAMGSTTYSRQTGASYGSGYWCGGEASLVPGYESGVERTDFANDTAIALPRTQLSSKRRELGAAGNSDYGWVGGGRVPSPAYVSTIDRISYRNDTAIAVIRGPLASARNALAATGNTNYGYFSGGYPGVATADRVDYSNDTPTMVAKGPLSAGRWNHGATGTKNYAYFTGGEAPSATSKVDRLDYTNDTATAVVKGYLSNARYWVASTGNEDYGYSGPSGPSATSIVDRIDFANDTSTALARGPLSIKKYGVGATGNNAFGYFSCGYANGDATQIDRVDYSNDTTVATARGALTNHRKLLAGVSARDDSLPIIGPYFGVLAATPKPYLPASQRGYIWRGTGVPSPAAGIPVVYDFPNSTTKALWRTGVPGAGPLNYKATGLGNMHYGYIGGGNPYTNVQRFDYANETEDVSVRGPLTSTTYTRAGVTNRTHGYWMGGSNLANSTVNRVDYGNDMVTASIRGPLAVNTQNGDACGNDNAGYVMKGDGKSYVQRINYANDTVAATTFAILTTGTPRSYCAGNKNYGWVCDGSGSYSTIERVDYSNDTATASTRGPMGMAHGSLASMTGNADYGICCFSFGQMHSGVTRITYANDTAVAVNQGLPTISYRYGHTTFCAGQDGQPQ